MDFNLTTENYNLDPLTNCFNLKSLIKAPSCFQSTKPACIIDLYYLFNIYSVLGGGEKPPPTSFSPVTSTNVGISLQNFLILSFNTFATLV